MIQTDPAILITDDDRAFRETLQSVFAPRGFRTHLAADGEEAVRIVRREQIHVVLLDMHMPRLSGIETACAVRQFNARLPCVLISADLDEKVRREAEGAKLFEMLEKPVEVATVTNVVADAFRQTYNWAVM